MTLTKDSKEVLEFVLKVDELHNKYMKERFNYLKDIPQLEIQDGKNRKYIKLVRDYSVFGFIDKESGDIYFAKSWYSPEKKNPRGNLFSEQGGMEAISSILNGSIIHPHIRYLR